MKRLLVCLLLVGVVGCGKKEQGTGQQSEPNLQAPNLLRHPGLGLTKDKNATPEALGRFALDALRKGDKGQFLTTLFRSEDYVEVLNEKLLSKTLVERYRISHPKGDRSLRNVGQGFDDFCDLQKDEISLLVDDGIIAVAQWQDAEFIGVVTIYQGDNFFFSREKFTHVSKSGDGKMTREEMPDDLQEFFDHADIDHDERISWDEATARLPMFGEAERSVNELHVVFKAAGGTYVLSFKDAFCPLSEWKFNGDSRPTVIKVFEFLDRFPDMSLSDLLKQKRINNVPFIDALF